MSAITATQMELLYSLAAPVTKNNFTTQAIITAPNTAARAIVNPAFWGTGTPTNGAGKALYGHLAGTVATTSAATVQIVLLWDPTPGAIGTTLATPWPTLAPTAAVTCLWELDFWITAQAVGGAGLTLQCNGKWHQSVVGTGVLSTAPQEVMFQTSTAALNSEAQAAIELAATWSAAAAGNTTTVQQFDLFGLN
jgi:hypothetical protein